tara:strand:+ start:34 stop:186 length:153 start_codon:yes stop_codon:yes gene_type:complete
MQITAKLMAIAIKLVLDKDKYDMVILIKLTFLGFNHSSTVIDDIKERIDE